MLKRTFDLIFATLLAVLFTPLALVIALAIWMESGGPLLYHSERVGRHGKCFFYHRFRTVKRPYAAPPYEPTRVGRFIGSLSLDEIPALWNILKGEMSFIGPRAERPEKVDLADPDWQKVLAVRPGLAGLGALTFLDRYNQTSVRERIQPEVYYVENQSFRLDMEILFKTLYLLMKMGHLKGRY